MAKRSIPNSIRESFPSPLLFSKLCARSFEFHTQTQRFAKTERGSNLKLAILNSQFRSSESDGCLVAPAVFKTVVGPDPGSRSVRFAPSPPLFLLTSRFARKS